MDGSMKYTIILMTFSLVISFLSALSINQQNYGWYIHLSRLWIVFAFMFWSNLSFGSFWNLSLICNQNILLFWNPINMNYSNLHSSYHDIRIQKKIYLDCSSGRCQCKENVEGRQCDRCRAGFFGLLPNNPNGCSSCW